MHYEKMCAVLRALLRKSTIALTLPIVLCATSCRTQKTTTQTATLTIQKDSAATTVTDSTAALMATVSTVDAEDVEQTVETVEWSEPDSLGNQHPVRTTRTATTRRRRTEQSAVAGAAVSRRTVERSQFNVAIDGQATGKTDVKPIKHNRMRTALIILVLLALVMLETWALVRHERKNREW